jgi:hypothetical protein
MTSDFAADGKAILDYLKSWPTTFVSGREIARRVGGKRRYAEDRFWAVPVLRHLVKEESLETDSVGGYRPCQKESVSSAKKSKNRRFVSPQYLKILKSSGKNFEAIVIDEEVPEDEKNPIPAYPGSPLKRKPGDSNNTPK